MVMCQGNFTTFRIHHACFSCELGSRIYFEYPVEYNFFPLGKTLAYHIEFSGFRTEYNFTI